MSFRALAAATRAADPDGEGLSVSYIAALAKGTERPGRGAMDLIARSFELSPAYFVEFRLATLRDCFDERRVGVTEAARRLRVLGGGLAPEAAQDIGAAPAGPFV